MYAKDIKKLTIENTNFRTVLHTGEHSQIVAMCILQGSEIGEEIHSSTDQMLFFVEGEGEAILNGETRTVGKDDVVFVPAGVKHNFKNTGKSELKLFTVYAPAEHLDGTVHKTKAEADKAESS